MPIMRLDVVRVLASGLAFVLVAGCQYVSGLSELETGDSGTGGTGGGGGGACPKPGAPLDCLPQPGKCDGTCAGKVCNVACADGAACPGAEVSCGDVTDVRSDCTITCGPNGCGGKTIKCPAGPGACTVVCDGIPACGMATIECGDGPCRVECSNGGCDPNSTVVQCGGGPCEVVCAMSQGPQSIESTGPCAVTENCQP